MTSECRLRTLAFLLTCLCGRALIQRNHIHTVDGYRGAESCSKLTNQDTHYTVQIEVGTPAQKLDLIADTGSSFPVIVQSCECRMSMQYFEECKETEQCFSGSQSTTYVAPKPTDNLIGANFGVGGIVARAATDIVKVGQVQAKMDKGLFLIVRRTFTTTYDFEGILGLGVPSWGSSEKGNSTDSLKNVKPGDEVLLPGFLEVAKVKAFSMCFNPGQGGALRLNPSAKPNMLKAIGRQHWSLVLAGISVGSSSVPVSVCDPNSKKAGHVSACAAIPDSGTTHIMGPKEGVNKILGDVCTRWPRCEAFRKKQNETSLVAFKKVLWDCNGWMNSGAGISEVPSIFVHLQGTDGTKNVLEITAMSYVYSTTSMTGNPVCAASLEVWEHSTKKHGTAWMLGTPLFYEYQAVFGLHPPSIGFSKGPCNLCGKTTSLLTKGSRALHAPRTMNGQPRLPSMDITDDL